MTSKLRNVVLVKRGAMPPPLLRSLHLSVDGPDGSRPTVATVKGGYDYWHYVCDGFNDRGWGCAYRTAQTMFSHHLREGGTCDVVGGGMSIPSVRKMQQILVDAGDKDKGFVGSADWIGSCEIALLFDVLYGVPCRLLSINNGSEVAATWSDALWDHFTREGTPVMCGGAALTSPTATTSCYSSSTPTTAVQLGTSPRWPRRRGASGASAAVTLQRAHSTTPVYPSPPAPPPLPTLPPTLPMPPPPLPPSRQRQMGVQSA